MSRLSQMTDVEIIAWLDKNIKLRKELSELCGRAAYDDGVTHHLLIYEVDDVKRISSLLNKQLEAEPLKIPDCYNDVQLKFEYLGIDVFAYARDLGGGRYE